MQINRHNYEEFFMLYVDGELNAAQRTEVENFVGLNADLDGEFASFKMVVLPVADNFIFENKNLLYKTSEAINLTNCNEYFLLYTDNELTAGDRQMVEKFVLQNPQVQEEFSLIKQTKLVPELIEFENKALLFREEKERRIIPFYWKMMAAATITGLVATLWVVTMKDQTLTTQGFTAVSPEKTVPANKGINEITSAQSKIETADITNAVKKENANNTDIPAQQKTHLPEKYSFAVVTQTPAETYKNKSTEQTAKNENGMEKNYTVATMQPINSQSPVPVEVNNAVAQNKNTVVSYASATNENDAVIVKPAAMNFTDNDAEDNSLYIGFAELNKTKVKNLFRKATAIFDKKANNDDGENSIRLANFEIRTK